MKIIKLPIKTVKDGEDWNAESVLRKIVLTLPIWRADLKKIDESLEIHSALDKSATELKLSTDASNALGTAMKLEGLSPSFGATFSRFYQEVFRCVLIAEEEKTE